MTLKQKLELCKGKLELYNGILFGSTGNSLEARFKLIKAVAEKEEDDLYIGFRIDNVDSTDFICGNVVRNEKDRDKIQSVARDVNYDLRRTVFYHMPYSRYYHDVLDYNTRCLLLDSSRDVVEQGCCNVKKISDYNELIGIKVKTKKDNRRR